MDKNDWRKDILERLEDFGKLGLSLLIDFGFLTFWAIVQWGGDKYIFRNIHLSRIDSRLLPILQWIFAIATLATVVIFIITDIGIIIKRAWKKFQEE